MAVIEELIRQENDGSISFGNHLASEKKKIQDFEVQGDLYKVKTYSEMTKIEKNGKMLMEVVPGATVHNFHLSDKGVHFSMEGSEDVQLTLELEPSAEYRILIDEVTVGKAKTNMAGKITLSVDLQNGKPDVKVEKIG